MDITQLLIQQTFEKARSSLNSKFGLNLSLCEQVALRNYSRVCLEEQSRCKDIARNFPSATGEAESRFLTEYYGLPILDEVFLGFCEDLGLDNVGEYLRRIQDRALLI